MDANLRRPGRRPHSSTVVRAGVTIGVTVWLAPRVRSLLSKSSLDGLSQKVDRLVGSQATLADSLERRLRALEETSARAEAEIRFVSSVVIGDRIAPTESPVTSTLTSDPLARHDLRSDPAMGGNGADPHPTGGVR